jgi:hypothetical protein
MMVNEAVEPTRDCPHIHSPPEIIISDMPSLAVKTLANIFVAANAAIVS